MKKKFNKIFPEDIISDILSRLPAKSLLGCKSVCKTWRDLIQLPRFPKMHLARLNHPDSADSGKLRYVFLKEVEDDDDDDDDDINFHESLCCFEFKENVDWNYERPISKRIMLETKCEACILIGSFNGLICVYGVQPDLCEINGPATIINPVTREYVVLTKSDMYPEYNKLIPFDHLACGFGYLAETNEYKVVRIYKCVREPNVVEVEVYTVGNGKGWRHVGKVEFGFGFDPSHEHPEHGVFLNGCLHWRNTKGGMVVVFDLAQEKFREHIPPPPLPTGTADEYVVDSIVLGVSGGGILYYAVCQFRGNEMFDDVWLLVKKDDNHVMRGQEQSWAWSQPDSLEQTEPFAFAEQVNVLRYEQGNIKYFSTSNSTWRDIVEFSEISVQVFPHKHTLVSLKELGEEDAKIMKSCGLEETYSSESDRD